MVPQRARSCIVPALAFILAIPAYPQAPAASQMPLAPQAPGASQTQQAPRTSQTEAPKKHPGSSPKTTAKPDGKESIAKAIPALAERQRALHALNRLAFGPRPGDVDA